MKADAAKQARRSGVSSDARARARAIRAIVFMNRLFECETRSLDVGLAQYRLLLFLRQGPKRASELAAHASVTRPALSTLIAGLERDRLIRRTTVQADRRGVRLEITRKGVDTIDRAEERFGRAFDDATHTLDRQRLLESLALLEKHLSAEPAARDAAPFARATGSAERTRACD